MLMTRVSCDLRPDITHNIKANEVVKLLFQNIHKLQRILVCVCVLKEVSSFEY